MTSPSFITTIWSELMIVESLWAMDSELLPLACL
jgi:hypothetical protein